MLKITNQYRVYVYLDAFDETYEIVLPLLSAHNLVIGNMYVDIGETQTVVNLNRPNEKADIRFERRGWFSSESFKFEGEAYIQEGKKKNIAHTIEGNWDKKCSITDAKTKQSLCVWTKSPYPERVAFMYGMAKFHIQMNYFPKRLNDKIAPTDTRRR